MKLRTRILALVLALLCTLSACASVPEVPFSASDIPPYTGLPYTVINDNVPFFSAEEFVASDFEYYSPLDRLGRCGAAYACIGKDLMPTEERGQIGSVKPSGWHTVKYDFVDGKYLYNRCHLIGFQLAGENANEQNLITGTRSMNTEGMLPFENLVADYVRETDNHVLYRVTPIFAGENLLATGVLMEAYSIEDSGDGICFNVFCYNEQPGVTIDHKSGASQAYTDASTPFANATYIANKSNHRLHLPDCDSVGQMKESNKIYLTCTRDEALAHGYTPCGSCKP